RSKRDWSSDVCSSDLGARRAGARDGVRGKLDRTRWAGRRLRLAEHLSALPAPDKGAVSRRRAGGLASFASEAGNRNPTPLHSIYLLPISVGFRATGCKVFI